MEPKGPTKLVPPGGIQTVQTLGKVCHEEGRGQRGGGGSLLERDLGAAQNTCFPRRSLHLAIAPAAFRLGHNF